MIHFKYKNNKYTIFFYPCGFMARVTEAKTKRSKEIKYNNTTKIKDFLVVLDKLQF